MRKTGLLSLLLSIFMIPNAAAENTVKYRGNTMNITIGQSTFSTELADTKAAQELTALLPLTLEMQDHLSNEKFAELPKALSRNDQAVGRIEAGDIMLWGGNTLVVFYESFQSSYRYTKLGKIKNTAQLKKVVGAGKVTMTFSP
ncbi:cyclophilin-like fold protein [uncultured Actinobacillus sp.]|uniref:cyclophilin-like fold protein n=1 Tax=uncultured Actinobacillus sp. TaxID=417616 RepID=UPI0025D27A90|nr:cyclophilin-like fold protein [uncultured Actinobacillus sp.]